MRKFLLQFGIIAFIVSVSIFATRLALAQSWQEPGAVPPGGNVPGVIWNSQLSGSEQSASFNVSGTGRIRQGAAFGGFTPDTVWMISSPTAYFGNGVAGTIIGAGGGQNAGDIKTDGNLYVVGRIGIGTTAPAYNLDVQGTGSTAYIRVGGAAQTNYTGLDLETNTGSGQFWKNGPGYTGYGGARSVNIYNSEDFPIAFFQGPSERMRINSGGNVGIGMTNPSSRLDVSGNINGSGDITGTRLCIGVDCRNAWPVAGGGGDITGVNAGTGIFGGGSSGEVTVSLDTAYADGLYVNTAGDTITGDLNLAGSADINAPGRYIDAQELCMSGDCRSSWASVDADTLRTVTNRGNSTQVGFITLDNDNAGTTVSINFVDGGNRLDWIPGGNNFEFNKIVYFRGGLVTTIGQNATFSGPVAVTGAGNYLTSQGPIAGKSVCSLTGNLCTTTTPYTNDFTISANTFCMYNSGTPDCRSSWPAAGGGGGGDITGVAAGSGLTGGGVSGELTVDVGAGAGLIASADTLDVGAGPGITVGADIISLDTTFADGRYVNVPGDIMTGDLNMSGLGTDINLNGGVINMSYGTYPQNVLDYGSLKLNANDAAEGPVYVSFKGNLTESISYNLQMASGFLGFRISDPTQISGDITINEATPTLLGAAGTGILTLDSDNGTVQTATGDNFLVSSVLAANGASLSSSYGVNSQGVYGIRGIGNGAGITYGVYGYANGGTTNWSGYFPGIGVSPFANVYVGDNLLVGATVEAISDPNFTLDGNDAYIGGDLGVNGNVHVDGDIRFSTITLGTCDSSLRGTLRFVEGTAGVKDRLMVCAKDAADSYAWRTIY